MNYLRVSSSESASSNFPIRLLYVSAVFLVIGSYCECFAAGVYCIDSCACENCFNKPEYEETVLDMRQQIESRNPLAFAPKIVNQGIDSPANVAVMLSNWIHVNHYRIKRYTNMRTLFRKMETGQLQLQPGTKEDAIARSLSVLKNIVNAFRYMQTLMACQIAFLAIIL